MFNTRKISVNTGGRFGVFRASSAIDISLSFVVDSFEVF